MLNLTVHCLTLPHCPIKLELALKTNSNLHRQRTNKLMMVLKVLVGMDTLRALQAAVKWLDSLKIHKIFMYLGKEP